MVRSFAITCGMVLTLGLCEATWAGAPLEYPRPCPTGCTPNVAGFGHFKTTWRQWPGEERLEQTNPQAIGRQVLPTPPGQEQVPLPRPAVRPQPPVPGLEGGIAPPAESLIPESILPEPPIEPKAGSLPTPSNEGTLPGLPIEPSGSPIPGPFDAGPATGPSTGSLLPSTPAPKESTKPTEAVKPPEAPKAKEPPKPKEEPKAKESKPTSSIWQGNTERTTAAASIDQNRVESQRAVVSVTVDDSPELRSLRLGSYRAESIATTPVELPAKQGEPATYAAVPIKSVEPATYGTTPARTVEPAAYATVESAGQLEVSDERSAPPIALNGYCPVELMSSGRWLLGDLRWTVVYEGHIYRLSGPTQRQQFLANPEAFAPAYSGNDAVLTVDQNRTVPGQAAYCATYNKRLYMFSNAGTQAQFNQNPQQYAVGK